ncbi:MAG: FecR family protein [Tannerellaceae bacterium]|nr:FecR family protein [Tannerellaceae bacterium]
MDPHLLQRYIEGNVSPEEIEQVVDWLDSDEKNVREFIALHKLYDISLFNQPGQQPEFKKKIWKIPFRKIVYEIGRIAVIFLIALSVFYFQKSQPGEVPTEPAWITFYAPEGQRAELTLPDQTQVWLNARSSITYPENFGKINRTIELKGEGYFNVTHNADRPFIVRTEKLDIEVIGTEFNVIAYPQLPETEVALIEGKVKLSALQLPEGYVMKEQEQVRLKDGKLFTSQIRDNDYFKWKEGLICFTNDSFDTIIRKLQLYYDIEIINNNPKLQQSRYTGKFRVKDGIEQVLKVLQLEHQFTYTKDNQQNIITIK